MIEVKKGLVLILLISTVCLYSFMTNFRPMNDFGIEVNE